jgi:hypothetical protein
MMNNVYTNLTCLTTDDPDTPCTIGAYPAYVIKAETVADIQAGVVFAKSHNVRLVIKNTGQSSPRRPHTCSSHVHQVMTLWDDL